MKSFLPLLFCFLFAMQTNAQNLVPNGSFEEHLDCPTYVGQIDSFINWYGYGGIPGFPGTPDYFNSCAPPVVSIPNNCMGVQGAFEGNSYIGVYTFDYSFWYREYVGCQLLEALIPGNNYSVSMR